MAIGLLLLNDHVLKAAAPGVVTGKLSDFAGLVFFPLFLLAAAELASMVLGRRLEPSHRHLVLAVLSTGAVFVAIKVFQPATDLYALSLGAGQWVGGAAASSLGGGSLPELRAVSAVRDPTDLIALPALLAAWVEGRRHWGFDVQVVIPSAPRLKLLPVTALIIAGLASIADQPPPPPGVVTDLVSTVSVPLSAGEAVVVRELLLTVAPNRVTEGVVVTVSAKVAIPDARILLVAADRQTHYSNVKNGVYGASLPLGRCDHYPCSHAVVLIVELTDLELAPQTLDVEVTASARTSANDLIVPAEALSLRGLEEGAAGPPPRIDIGEVGGELTLDLAHPVVEQEVLVHLEPGAVADGRLMFTDTRLYFESDDTDETMRVDVRVAGYSVSGRIADEPGELFVIEPLEPGLHGT